MGERRISVPRANEDRTTGGSSMHMAGIACSGFETGDCIFEIAQVISQECGFRIPTRESMVETGNVFFKSAGAVFKSATSVFKYAHGEF